MSRTLRPKGLTRHDPNPSALAYDRRRIVSEQTQTRKRVKRAPRCDERDTREIVGFTIILDQDEPWFIGSSETTFDVQNTATHEFGHAAGLGHVHPPKAGCLTMYPYVAFGEIQKRTLGLGDKLGMQTLYNSTDITAGSCGS